MGRGNRDDAAEQEPLVPPHPPASHPYNYCDRPRRDSVWGILYALSLAAVTVGGVYAYTHRNTRFGDYLRADYLSDPSHCPIDPHAAALLAQQEAGGGGQFEPTFFLASAGAWIGVSVAGGLALGLLSLLLFKTRPHSMVSLTVVLQVAVPLAVGIAACFNQAPAAGVPFLVMGATLALVYWLYREQLVLVGHLLRVSVRALADLPGMVLASILLQVAGVVLTLPLGAAMFLAYTNGHVARNPSVAHVSGEKVCTTSEGDQVTCCAWQPEPWAQAYMGATAGVLAWTGLLVFCIKTFVVAGATAQWYFAPAVSPSAATRGATLRSLRHALGPSFGSLALASWILALIEWVRAALAKAREQADANVLVALLVSCLDFFYVILEQLTKFGVIRAAISGEPFMEASRTSTLLLARNLLNTVGVWWFPGLILQMAAFLFSAGWAMLAGFLSYHLYGGSREALHSGIAIGGVAFVFAYATLAFLNSVLLSVVDAAYFCWAMDVDMRTATRPDVHGVFVQLPSVKQQGGMVENPDGTYAYGASPPVPPV